VADVTEKRSGKPFEVTNELLLEMPLVIGTSTVNDGEIHPQ
jgi:hypothetical protein